MSRLILITILLANLVVASAQDELMTIPLDASLGEVKEIMQFSDQEGNALYKFRSKNNCQFNIIHQDSLVASKTTKLNKYYDFLDCLYDEESFNLLYRNKKNGALDVYHVEKQFLPNQVSKTNIQKSDEDHLADYYDEGEFLVFNYSKSPFTLHAYRYEGNQHFEKRSQTFQNSNKEKAFVGQILSKGELIIVRRTFNPFTLHFYRYFNDRGFEKRSVNLKSIYKKAGFEKKIFPSDAIIDVSTELPAFIDGSDIYLDMENLVHINPVYFRKKNKNKKRYPGVLRLNWDSKDGEILYLDTSNEFIFRKRSVALQDKNYFKLLVNQDSFELSIYDITKQSLIKKYAYNKNQRIDLIYKEALLNKNSTIYLDFFFSIPIGIEDTNTEIIDTDKLLYNLSADDLFLDVYNEENHLELRILGINRQTILVDKVFTASFVSYLSKSDLSIIKKVPESEDPRWKKVDEYIANLMKTNKHLGEFIAYQHQENIYIAYIDKNKQHCKIITF